MVVFWTALADGIELRTLDNLEVGDSRADVISLDPIPLWSKGEGEDAGEPDGYCLQSENVPDTQSLFRPGHGGIDCVRVTVEDDVVGTIRSPWGDWHDV